MLNHQKIEAALTALTGEFAAYQQDVDSSFSRMRLALTDFGREPFDRIQAALAAEWTGAIPSPEWAAHPDFRIPFHADWQNHQQARQWAFDHILNIPTFAVDGSQIRPTTDYSLPVAIIQIGWFENLHTPQAAYKKDTYVEVVTPQRLLINGEPSGQMVDLIRTRLEMAQIVSYINSCAATSTKPVVFYDGPLLLSFAERLRETKAEYIAELTRVLNASYAARIPVIGYVDSSHARDLIGMMTHYFHIPKASDALTDGGLLADVLQIGERTPVMISRRPGIQQEYAAPWQTDLAFVYLKMSLTGLPVRLEFPLWLYQEGLLDSLMDVIRAEIIIGSGYPYCLETADVTALLTNADRDFFYRVFQAFLEKQAHPLTIRSKARSKQRRR